MLRESKIYRDDCALAKAADRPDLTDSDRHALALLGGLTDMPLSCAKGADRQRLGSRACRQTLPRTIGTLPLASAAAAC